MAIKKKKLQMYGYALVCDDCGNEDWNHERAITNGNVENKHTCTKCGRVETHKRCYPCDGYEEA